MLTNLLRCFLWCLAKNKQRGYAYGDNDALDLFILSTLFPHHQKKIMNNPNE